MKTFLDDPPSPDLARLCVNTIRMLAVDAIEAARSGHPGAPLGAADLAFVLWTRFLRFDPTCPEWPDRDRFVLSAGHASMLLYALLHLFGYDLPLEEIKRFRQWGSKTPGHPEYGLTPGVEVTTGPLGQGIAHAVGMALGGKMLSARFNREEDFPISFRVFVLCGDGDLMEGVSYEAASLAGHLRLSNLVCLYDSNGITIEGSTDLAFSEDVAKRFVAAGWHVSQCDGYDHEAIANAIAKAIAEERPSLVVAKTEIGHGAPTMHGSHHTHGAPLGPKEVKAMKEAFGWPLDEPFYIPGEVKEYFATVAERGRRLRLQWEERFSSYRRDFQELAQLWDAYFTRPDREVLAKLLARPYEGQEEKRPVATRVISGRVINEAAKVIPNLVGGSADLAPSNQTEILDGGHVIPSEGEKRFLGRNLHFGVREHGMAAIVSGLNLTGAFRAYGGTFLVFSDYMKPALRLAAMMEVPSIFVFTHDSFAVGEDGPTHQPVEQLWALRSIPGMTVFRPADAIEVAAAWAYALSREKGPVAICLTRQPVQPLPRPEGVGIEEALRGGYCLYENFSSGRPECLLIATGSEVFVAYEAALALKDIAIRVISMPSIEVFEAQPRDYKESVLPKGVPVVCLEAGSTVGWYRYAGREGLVIGLDHFGASAPAEVLADKFGFTGEAVAARIRKWWEGRA